MVPKTLCDILGEQQHTLVMNEAVQDVINAYQRERRTILCYGEHALAFAQDIYDQLVLSQELYSELIGGYDNISKEHQLERRLFSESFFEQGPMPVASMHRERDVFVEGIFWTPTRNITQYHGVSQIYGIITDEEYLARITKESEGNRRAERRAVRIFQEEQSALRKTSMPMLAQQPLNRQIA